LKLIGADSTSVRKIHPRRQFPTMTFHSRLDKSQLPVPRPFYESELGQLSRENRRGWAQGRCPFHESKSGKSFSVNLASGGFYCHGCQAAGGDIVDFLRLRHNFTFPDAKRHLGIENSAPTQPVQIVPVKYLVFDFEVDGAKHRAEVKDEPVTYRGKIRRFYRDARERMAVLGPGESEAHETCWERMALGFEELESAE
jgi:hypothetical protein